MCMKYISYIIFSAFIWNKRKYSILYKFWLRNKLLLEGQNFWFLLTGDLEMLSAKHAKKWLLSLCRSSDRELGKLGRRLGEHTHVVSRLKPMYLYLLH